MSANVVGNYSFDPLDRSSNKKRRELFTRMQGSQPGMAPPSWFLGYLNARIKKRALRFNPASFCPLNSFLLCLLGYDIFDSCDDTINQLLTRLAHSAPHNNHFSQATWWVTFAILLCHGPGILRYTARMTPNQPLKSLPPLKTWCKRRITWVSVLKSSHTILFFGMSVLTTSYHSIIQY